MEMPQPDEAHKRLQKLVGEWRGEEKMKPSPWDPEGGTAIGRVSNRLALDGFNVIQDYTQERDGKVTFRGHGVFGWDMKTRDYVLSWFDSMGSPPEQFRGHFEGDVLTMTSRNAMGHSRAIFQLGQADTYEFKMDMSQDGSEWQNLMEGRYERAG